MKYNLFDDVYFVYSGSHLEKYVTCPDCGGNKYMTVVLYNGEQFTIDCEGCKIGYLPPTGKVKTYVIDYKIILGKVVGVSKENETFVYRIEYYYFGENTNGESYSGVTSTHLEEYLVYKTPEEAKSFGEAEVIRLQQEEDNKINRKIKRDKGWSWHVSYYRKQIKDAKKQLEYAERALNVAKSKSKEPDETPENNTN